jgi:2-oxo-4-hydroxy-4-carboxy-5-ureidoimidazoline decarboxylase
MKLDDFNNLSSEDATSELKACLGCGSWAEHVENARPFTSIEALIENGSARWSEATEAERLEAFSAHPQIGDLEALRNKYANTASAEQGQITEADESVLLELQKNNQTYLDKNRFIFIVCATGKSAAEMLALLNQRMPNDRSTEVDTAAAEQWQITLIRLNKLFSEEIDS